jgi:hypothetical protein
LDLLQIHLSHVPLQEKLDLLPLFPQPSSRDYCEEGRSG